MLFFFLSPVSARQFHARVFAAQVTNNNSNVKRSVEQCVIKKLSAAVPPFLSLNFVESTLPSAEQIKNVRQSREARGART